MTEIQAPLIGGLLPFPRLSGTLSSRRAANFSPLSITIDNIYFDYPTYIDSTLTEEGELFLSYDVKRFQKRILVFMSQGKIEWLKCSIGNHGDGLFPILCCIW